MHDKTSVVKYTVLIVSVHGYTNNIILYKPDFIQNIY